MANDKRKLTELISKKVCIATILTNVVLLFLRNRNEYYLIMVLLFIAPHKRENKCHCE